MLCRLQIRSWRNCLDTSQRQKKVISSREERNLCFPVALQYTPADLLNIVYHPM